MMLDHILFILTRDSIHAKICMYHKRKGYSSVR